MKIPDSVSNNHLKGLCTLSPNFSHVFFRIRNPKNVSFTETLHTESDAYYLIGCKKNCETIQNFFKH